MGRLLPQRAFPAIPAAAVWSAVLGYLGYVVLGPLDWRTHKWLYTGDPRASVWDNLRRGQIATFGKEVYAQFFFPSFHRYRKLYESHTLCAGTWLITGVFNLRNQPVGRQQTASGRWLHTRLSGYVYALSSVITGLTASVMSLKSHSLGIAKYPLAGYGMWMAWTLVLAMRCIWRGDVAGHKVLAPCSHCHCALIVTVLSLSLCSHCHCALTHHLVHSSQSISQVWMVRNFASGAGSIWVRFFAAFWAAADLSFMEDVDTYRRMNNIVLVAGFSQGIVFGEWWLARTARLRVAWAVAQAVLVASTLYAAKRMYRELALERRGQQTKS